MKLFTSVFFQNKFTEKLHCMEAPIHADFRGALKNLLIISSKTKLNEAKLLYFLQGRNFFCEERREFRDVFFGKIKTDSRFGIYLRHGYRVTE